MINLGEVSRDFSMTANIRRAFHQLLLVGAQVTLDPLQTSLRIAASGLEAQSTRLRIVSENIANAQSTGSSAGADPYARKTVSFESALDRATGADAGRGQGDRNRSDAVQARA